MDNSHCCAHDSEGDQTSIAASVAKPGQFTCPMHPEVVAEIAGDCPACGMALDPVSVDKVALQDDTELRHMRRLFWISLPFTVSVFILAMGDSIPGLNFRSSLGGQMFGWLQALLTTPVLFWCGGLFLLRGWRSIVGRAPNMWTLISIGTLAAYGFSLAILLFPDSFPTDVLNSAHGAPLYFEAAAVIISLVLLGQVLELRARGQTSLALLELLDLAPPIAILIDDDGSEREVALADVVVGQQLRVKPGGKIPVDGEVVQGSATIDESMLTGEPLAVERSPGDAVSSGTLIQSGSIVIRAVRVGEQTLLSRIIDLVAQAQRSRAPIQRLADIVAGWFVPIVVAAALAAYFIWMAVGPQPEMIYALVASVSVLIIACPCALGLATPMSVIVGIGRGARDGVLIRDAEVLETFQSVDVLVCDKTGTLTEGLGSLTAIETFGAIKEDELLRLAATVERASEHPLADAIVQAAIKRSLELAAVTDFLSIAGQGIQAKVEDQTIVIGNAALLGEHEIDVEIENARADHHRSSGATVVWVGIDGQLVGLLVVADLIKNSTPAALAALRKSGLRILMATGDNRKTAEAIGQELKIDEIHAELSPIAKHDLVKSLQDKGLVVALAGDGINDAPALAQADIGIAMGTGTDIAMETASVTLVKGDLRGIVKARNLSVKTMQNIRQNLFFAFFYNALGVPIAAGALYPLFGFLLSPMLAAAAMSLSSVSVIGNALRLRRIDI
jgi:Cu+-exporting ATPase